MKASNGSVCFEQEEKNLNQLACSENSPCFFIITVVAFFWFDWCQFNFNFFCCCFVLLVQIFINYKYTNNNIYTTRN